MSKSIRVLIVDDSAVVRKMLKEVLQTDSEIEIVGTASDPYDARKKIKKLKPDVLTLDIEMPKMDGITFLANLMRLNPMPVLMVSSMTVRGADVVFQALEYGAVDYISKPKFDLAYDIEQFGAALISKIKVAAVSKVKTLTKKPSEILPDVEEKYKVDAVLNKQAGNKQFLTTEPIIAIGASTGGTEAIKDILMALPATTPGAVITQHIPAAFSAKFAQRLDKACAMKVCEAKDNQKILSGHAYVAPGDKHLMVVREGTSYHCKLCDGVPVNRHKPAVDVLFRSVAESAGKNTIAVLLTGMGDDGAQGLKDLQESGAVTIAQDKESSVVWGMPGSAVKLGVVDSVLPLHMIAGAIMSYNQNGKNIGNKNICYRAIR